MLLFRRRSRKCLLAVGLYFPEEGSQANRSTTGGEAAEAGHFCQICANAGLGKHVAHERRDPLCKLFGILQRAPQPVQAG